MNPAPSLQGSLWNGNQQLATKNQLLSSISGLYNDIQDIELSSITIKDLKVSTLTAAQYISAPYLNVSSINAGLLDVSGILARYISTPFINVSTIHADNLDISGLLIDASGIFYAQYVSSSLAEFNITLLSSLQFKFDPQLKVDVHVEEAFSGFLLGLGGLLFETLLGLGGGIGLTFQGIGNGLASMIWGRGGNTTYINNQVFELLAGNTQIQVSTLGDAYPLYSSITRLVSSPVANGVPGTEIFLSSFITPGTTCIRSISDPFPLVTQNSNINSSTIQSFGQWVPILGNDYFLNFSTMNGTSLTASTITSSNLNTSNLLINYDFQPGIIMSNRESYIVNNSGPYPGVGPFDYQISTLTERAYYYNRFQISSIYPSTFTQGTSTFGATTALDPADITGPPVLADFTQLYQAPGLPNTFVTAWNVSSATYDVMNSGSGALQILIPPTAFYNDFLGSNNRVLVLPNQNRRVSWNIDPANNTGVSTVTTIPAPVPTTVTNNFITEMIHERDPYEDVYSYYLTQSPQLGNVAFNVSTMSFGHPTTRDNGAYAFQFHGDTNIYGTLECDTLIVLSSIVAISTIIEVESVLSTQTVNADIVNVSTINIDGFVNALNVPVVANTIRLQGASNLIDVKPSSIVFNDFVGPRFALNYEGFSSMTWNAPSNAPQARFVSNRFEVDTISTGLVTLSSLTADFGSIFQLNVDSFSTSSHSGDTITANYVNVLSNLQFQTPQFTNLFDQADISKITTLTSTSFGAVSSLTNNILNYSLTVDIPDQTIFNLSASNATGLGVDYRMSPANVEQWGSTILLFDEYQNPGDIILNVSTAFAGMTGTFDLSVQLASGQQYVNSFYVQQANGFPPGPIPGQNLSTLLFVNNPEDGSSPVTTGTWRFFIGPTGWVESVTPNPTPYATTNNNQLLVAQSLTDVGVYTTDRLLVFAGDTVLNGNFQTSNIATNDITCGFISLPSINNFQNAIQMEFSNTTTSNSYNLLYGSLKEGSAFPQLSNIVYFNLTSSNASINTEEDLEITTNQGDTVSFTGNVQNVVVANGDLKANAVLYGDSATGFLAPRAFAMSNTTGFGAGTTITASGQVTDGTNTFVGTDYNCIISLRSFAQTNGAVAYNSVIIVPYIDPVTQTWYWSLQADINVGSAGGDGVFSWNVLMFPYNMMP